MLLCTSYSLLEELIQNYDIGVSTASAVNPHLRETSWLIYILESTAVKITHVLCHFLRSETQWNELLTTNTLLACYSE
jgi:hypothetical protein